VKRTLLIALVTVSCGRCRSLAPSDGGTLSASWLEGRPEVETQLPKYGGTLVVRSMVEPVTLNGLEGISSRETWTLRITRNLVTESLIALDPSTLALVPQLAVRWEDASDHRKTTFFLRRDRRFHDGRALTARDVIATLEAVSDATRPTAAIRQDFGSLESFRAIDDFTVELTWREPSPFALRQVAQLPILCATQLAGDWSALAKAPMGTGPFRVDAWDKGSQLTLTRVGEAFLDRIVFRFVKDHTIATSMLERGEFDLMTAVQPTVWRGLEAPTPKNVWAQQGYRRLVSVDNSYSYIAWNEARPVFQDLRVRKALAHLYPGELVERSVDLGLEKQTTCPYWVLGPQCDTSVQPFTFSVAAAQALLADAGFIDSDGDGIRERGEVALRFSFLVPATSVRLGKVVPLLQEQARAAGADVVIEQVDIATLSTRVSSRDFDVVSRVWTESDLESDLFGTFHSSACDGGSNFIGYSSAEADRLMESIRREWNEPKRRELERALHRQLYADQPYLFMTSRRSLDLAKHRVHGLSPSLLWYDLRRVWVDN
jgi:peptide/nickel transport system substrate-binding protein